MKKLSNIKELKNKILSLYSITISLFICIFFVFLIYYINNLSPKHIAKIDIDDKIVKDVKLTSIEIGKLFSKIEIEIELTEEDKKESIRYITGYSQGYYFDYSIIFQSEENTYKIKTFVLHEGNKLILKGCFFNNILREKYNIILLQNDYDENNGKKEIYYFDIGEI